MPFIDTRKLETREKRPGWRGRTFHSGRMSFAHWEFEHGSTIHRHSHTQEEVWNVIAGRLEVTIGTETGIAGPGMVAIIPSNTPHSVKALTDGNAIVADSPRRDI